MSLVRHLRRLLLLLLLRRPRARGKRSVCRVGDGADGWSVVAVDDDSFDNGRGQRVERGGVTRCLGRKRRWGCGTVPPFALAWVDISTTLGRPSDWWCAKCCGYQSPTLDVLQGTYACSVQCPQTLFETRKHFQHAFESERTTLHLLIRRCLLVRVHLHQADGGGHLARYATRHRCTSILRQIHYFAAFTTTHKHKEKCPSRRVQMCVCVCVGAYKVQRRVAPVAPSLIKILGANGL